MNLLREASPASKRFSPVGIPARPFGNTSTWLGYSQKISSEGERRRIMLTFNTPSWRRSWRLSWYKASKRLAVSGEYPPNTCTIFVPSLGSTCRVCTSAIYPPVGNSSTAVSCVLLIETESKMYLRGSPSVVIWAISSANAELDRFRSKTCVAPINLSSSEFFRDAVVIMGKNPECFAS